eukprot:4001407-Prymnesium_polylepis.1
MSVFPIAAFLAALRPPPHALLRRCPARVLCAASAAADPGAISLAERRCSTEPERFRALREETAERWPGGAHM